MHRKPTVIVAVAVCAVMLTAAASLRTYIIRSDSGGIVLWNSNEAYLFIGVSRRGLHPNYLEYAWVFLEYYLHGSPPPDDDLGSSIVIRVTPSAVEHYVFYPEHDAPGSYPDLFTPFEDRIYANCPYLGGLCRWSGDHFERATEEEQHRFGGTNGLAADSRTDVNGWSKDGIAAGPANVFTRFATDVGGKFTLSEKSELIGHTGYAAVSINVQRPGQAPERIWYLDGHPRRVSKAEYERVFG